MKKKWTCLSICLCLLASCDRSAKPTHSFEVASVGLHSAALNSDGQHVTVGSIYHGASYWTIDSQSPERLFNWNHDTDEPTTIIAADFSDNDKWALTSAPHTMVLWDTQSGKGERYWTAPAEVLDVELNDLGSLALLGLDDHTAVIFDIRRGGIRRTFKHDNRVRSVDFNRDGTLAITGSEDYTATVWNTQTGQPISKIKHEDDVQLVQLSDDGSLALSVSKYDKALIWHPHNAEHVAEIPLKAERLKRGIRFTAARFSHDNRLLLTGRPDQIVQLWQLDPMHEIARWKLPKRDIWKPTSSAVIDVSFSKSDGTFIAVGSAGFVHTLTLPKHNSINTP